MDLIERQLGISRHDFKINCDFDFKGIAEVVALPSERIILTSVIDRTQARKYFSSVVLTDSEFEDSLYKGYIHFDWFSERYESQNKSIQTRVTGVKQKGTNGYTKFDFQQQDEPSSEKTVWVFSLRGADGSWAPTYALRIKPEAKP